MSCGGFWLPLPCFGKAHIYAEQVVIPLGAGVVGRVAIEGVPVVVDLRHSFEWRQALREQARVHIERHARWA